MTTEKRIGALCAPLYDDAAELVTALAMESRGVFAWRPVRAGAILALAEAEPSEDRVWMTLDEFDTWRERLGLMRRGGPKLPDVLGIGKDRLKSIRSGSPITRLESLACAHYAMGLEPPIATDDSDVFADWVANRFGATDRLCRWLQIRSDYLTDRMRGYDIKGGKRVIRTPNITLIRALDWVWRMGPVSPYGDRPDVPMWPGQREVV